MARQRYDAVVVGAGIAGIAAAHALTEAGLARVALVESGPVLGLISDKSTECHRNCWPGPGDAMVGLMNRSIDLMTEHARRSGNRFVMNRRGQVYATARPEVAEALDRRGHEAEELGASMLRVAISARDYVSAAA